MTYPKKQLLGAMLFTFSLAGCSGSSGPSCGVDDFDGVNNDKVDYVLVDPATDGIDSFKSDQPYIIMDLMTAKRGCEDDVLIVMMGPDAYFGNYAKADVKGYDLEFEAIEGERTAYATVITREDLDEIEARPGSGFTIEGMRYDALSPDEALELISNLR